MRVKHKYIRLDDLPKYKNGANKNRINWNESIGRKIYFEYDDLKGYVLILDNKHDEIKVEYNGYSRYMYKSDFRKCSLGRLLKKYTNEFKYDIGEKIISENKNLTILKRKYKKDNYGNNRRMYKYHCNICCYEGWREEHSFKTDNCPCCSNQRIIKGVNDITTTDP